MPELKFTAGFCIGEHGEYRILNSQPLSAGVKNNFAEVYLAVKSKTRKEFAVKILLPSMIHAYQRSIDDFQQEIKLLMNLNHRYIIRIEYYGILKDTTGLPSVYLITEFVPDGKVSKPGYSYPAARSVHAADL